MKSFAKILALVFVSIPGAYAAGELNNALDSMLLTQRPVTIQFSPKLDPANIDCNQSRNTFNTAGTLNGWAANNQLISKIYTCDSRKVDFNRFNSSSCVDAINCRKNIAQMQGKSSEKLLNEIIAKDYAKNMLDLHIGSMDRLETLKKFASEKYGIKSDKCNDRYQPSKKSGVCNLGLLDEVFVNQQENCKFGSRCFRKVTDTVLSFKDYKNNKKIPDSAFVVDYNEYRIEQKVKSMMGADKDFVNGLAVFVTSDAFKAASLEKRAEMFLKKMESEDDGKLIDPVLAMDLESFTEAEKQKGTLKYKQLLDTFKGEDLTQDSFKTAYEAHRKRRAENMLVDNATCSETTDLKHICEEMTSLSKGAVVYKNAIAAENLSSRNLSKERDFERFKSLMDDKFSESDYEILINAKRCISYGLASEEYSQVVSSGKSDKGKSLGAMVGEQAGPNEDIVDSSRSKLSTSSYVTDASSAAKAEAVKMLEPKAESDGSSDTDINSALANNQVPLNNLANQFNQAFTPGAYGLDDDDRKEKAEKKEEVVVTPVTPAVAANDSKMTDLMKRLASAEEKVDKMKAANEEAENNRIKQKKIDEENALIKELKGQIADLKATKEKKEADKEIAIANPIIEQQKPQTNNYASSFNNGVISAPARQEAAPKVADNYDSGRSSGGGSVSNAISSRGGASSMVLTSTVNSEGNKVLPSGLVLTTVDGMSSEKATQTISNKIIELNGTPFYIEEGGMVKEIIAVVKDGKVLLDDKGNPIYEKIVKGKVGDKKFAKAKDKTRAPAAITDAADLKRDQEEKMKRDRAEYLKLKNLTNGIIKAK